MLNMAPNGLGYPIHHLGSALASVFSHNFLCNASLLTDGEGWEEENYLSLCKYWPAVAKSFLNYYFQHKFKHNPVYQPLWRILSVFQPKPEYVLSTLPQVFKGSYGTTLYHRNESVSKPAFLVVDKSLMLNN